MGAMLFLRPGPFAGRETVNDLDGFVSNFWRAVRFDPEAVAYWAEWPVIENDLHARHLWLKERGKHLPARLEGDPDYYDAKIAGWWAWGQCTWIGWGWSYCDGPWFRVLDDEGYPVLRRLPRSDGDGRGADRPEPATGVIRRLPRLNGEAGLHRPRHRAGGECPLPQYLLDLSRRLRRVRVCCGDWSRVLTHSVTDHHGLTAVFLDPPYATNRDDRMFARDDRDVHWAAREWAIRNGDNPKLRIALCGYKDDFAMPAGWSWIRGKRDHGYGNMARVKGASGHGSANAYREVIWLSPACLGHVPGQTMTGARRS
jgi:hypothetical protein